MSKSQHKQKYIINTQEASAGEARTHGHPLSKHEKKAAVPADSCHKYRHAAAPSSQADNRGTSCAAEVSLSKVTAFSNRPLFQAELCCWEQWLWFRSPARFLQRVLVSCPRFPHSTEHMNTRAPGRALWMLLVQRQLSPEQ